MSNTIRHPAVFDGNCLLCNADDEDMKTKGTGFLVCSVIFLFAVVNIARMLRFDTVVYVCRERGLENLS